MKPLITLFVLFVLANNTILSQAPTNAGIPDANHVLVVYNSNSDTSALVANYYKNARGIPTANVFGLYLPDTTITIDGVTHPVLITQETDIIQDSINNALNAVYPTFHAWRYYLDYIANPIKEYLTSHNLTSTIRYIVLCKGVPFKIQARGDWPGLDGTNGNLTVDGLLCMLNTENYDSLITNKVYPGGGISNPYHNVDPNFTMDYGFLPDHFITEEGYKLSYLVSHLDGVSYDVVKGIIDRSLNPDVSNTAAWILDGDPAWSDSRLENAKENLELLGFNVLYDNTNTWITHYDGQVMGYSSWGTHAEDGNCFWEDSAWVVDSLHFNLSNGAVFNTMESFNGNSLTTLKWRNGPFPYCSHTQGLSTQFTEIGGTGTMGHAWEPGLTGVVDNSIFFPSYALGYPLVDAIYQGVINLADENFVVGDPLLRITVPCTPLVITSDTTITSAQFSCGIEVPEGKTLTIAPGAVVDFYINSSINLKGNLVVSENSVLNFNNFGSLNCQGNTNIVVASTGALNFNQRGRLSVL